MRSRENAAHHLGKGALGSPACRPGSANSPMHHTPRSKAQHGTPVSGLRRNALQQSQAANSPAMRPEVRPATAPQARAGGAGGTNCNDVTESNIKVYIRTRPAATISGATCVTAEPESSTVFVQSQGTDVKGTPRKGRSEDPAGGMDTFLFEDGVLDPEISQEDVFETIGRPASQAVLEGYNVTIFAYGQTGAGKTHSIYGGGGQCDEDSTNPRAGLTERVMKFLIASGSAEVRSCPFVSYRYAVSMLDIYDEKVSDLFEPGHEKTVRQDPKGGVYVEGQNWKLVTSCSQAAARVQQGLQGRKVCYTALNSESSRSHTICMFRVSRDEKQDDGEVLNRAGVITIVDLCGSERVKKSEVEGERKKEAININKSLSALKTVITALGSGSGHVPFRDSKLTWVLKDNIGGNSKVAIIAHINPCVAHAYESVSTLRFVSVVKTVKTRCSRNERFKSAHELAELAAQEAEERRLLQIQAQAIPITPPSPPPSPPEMTEASTQVSPLRALRDELGQLKDLFSQGALSLDEYQSSRRRALALWQPSRPHMSAPMDTASEDVLSILTAGLDENDDPNHRQSLAVTASSRDRALSIKIHGPEAGSESECVVRCSATVESVVEAVGTCYSCSGGLVLVHQGQPLQGRRLISELNLCDGAVLLARPAGPHTPPPPCVAASHDTGTPSKEFIIM